MSGDFTFLTAPKKRKRGETESEENSGTQEEVTSPKKKKIEDTKVSGVAGWLYSSDGMGYYTERRKAQEEKKEVKITRTRIKIFL